jgi:hypothetical protein
MTREKKKQREAAMLGSLRFQAYGPALYVNSCSKATKRVADAGSEGR